MAEEAMPATEAPFMEAAKGRVPLSTNAGSANIWFPGDVPRPDRDYDTLWWHSLFGLGSALGITDFYMRSPITGLIKLIIFIVLIAATPVLGGFAMIWGIWEFLHITYEKSRVVNYGLSAPFDAWHGIGQGMVTDKPTNYTQRSNFTAWQATSILSFLGIDGLATGKPGLFFRKFLDAAILGGCLYGIVHLIAIGASWVGIFFLALFTLFPLFFVIYPYYITLKAALGKPDTLFTTGLNFEGRIVDFYNYYGLWAAGAFGDNTERGMRYDIGVTSVSGKVFKKLFEIYYENPEMKRAAEEAKAAEGEASTPPGAWIAKYSSILSFAMGSLPLAPIFVPLMWFLVGYIPVEVGYGAAAVLRGDTPVIPEAPLPGFDRVGGLVPSIIPTNLGDVAKTAFMSTKAARNVGSQFALKQAEAAGRITAARDAAAAAAGMAGGARKEPEQTLSTESIALGATVAALIAGGAIKLAVDTLMPK